MGRTTPAPLLLNCFFSHVIALRTRVLISPQRAIACSLDANEHAWAILSCSSRFLVGLVLGPSTFSVMQLLTRSRSLLTVWRTLLGPYQFRIVVSPFQACFLTRFYWASGTRLEIYFVVPALRDLYSRDVPTIPLYYCLFKKKIVYWLLHVFLAKFHLELAGSPWNSFWYIMSVSLLSGSYSKIVPYWPLVVVDT